MTAASPLAGAKTPIWGIVSEFKNRYFITTGFGDYGVINSLRGQNWGQAPRDWVQINPVTIEITGFSVVLRHHLWDNQTIVLTRHYAITRFIKHINDCPMRAHFFAPLLHGFFSFRWRKMYNGISFNHKQHHSICNVLSNRLISVFIALLSPSALSGITTSCPTRQIVL
jgi:hypothetical protein